MPDGQAKHPSARSCPTDLNYSHATAHTIHRASSIKCDTPNRNTNTSDPLRFHNYYSRASSPLTHVWSVTVPQLLFTHIIPTNTCLIRYGLRFHNYYSRTSSPSSSSSSMPSLQLWTTHSQQHIPIIKHTVLACKQRNKHKRHDKT